MVSLIFEVQNFKTMKTVKHIMMALTVVVALTSCRDKAACRNIRPEQMADASRRRHPPDV